jgi:hypothetical protein
MKSTSQLKELIDFLRQEGVTSYEEDGIRLTLSPTRPPQKELPQAIAESKEAEQSPERDPLYGLTAQERLDLFNES